MNRSEIRERILSALNENVDSPTFWTTGEIDELIAEAQEVLAEEALGIKRTAYIPIQAGSYLYSTRRISDLMAPWRIWYSALNRRLRPVTIRELDQRSITWSTVSGHPEVWFPVSWDSFGLWPRAAAASGNIRIDYFAWPEIMLDDDDEPEWAEADHDTLVLYGVYDGLVKRWDFEKGLAIFAKFAERVPMGRSHSTPERLDAIRGKSASFRTGVIP